MAGQGGAAGGICCAPCSCACADSLLKAPTPTPPLSCSAPFWQPTSIAMGLFSLPEGGVPLLHFSATPLSWVLNAPNYTGGLVGCSCGRQAVQWASLAGQTATGLRFVQTSADL